MSTIAQNPATTPIPVQLSAPEFEAFLLPHLSMPKRGPKCKLGYHRVFNFILCGLYTGMQWKCLPIPHDAEGKAAMHYTRIYKVFKLVASFTEGVSQELIQCWISSPRGRSIDEAGSGHFYLRHLQHEVVNQHLCNTLEALMEDRGVPVDHATSGYRACPVCR